MTKQEAIEAMKAGNKVSHWLFSHDEWMTMVDGKIVTEEGYKHPAQEFWSYRLNSAWNEGYFTIDNKI